MIANPTEPPPVPAKQLADVKGRQLPYSSVNMAAGCTGKTAARRSMLGEVFVKGALWEREQVAEVGWGMVAASVVL